jgi:hypothetical protein
MQVSRCRIAYQFELDETAVAMILSSLESSIDAWSIGDDKDQLELLRDIRIAFYAALMDCKNNCTL